MARRFGFKPTLRTTMLANAAYLAAMSKDGKLPADLAASLAHSLPPAPKKRYPRMDGVDIDRIHSDKSVTRTENLSANADDVLESAVITAVSQLLAVHPLVQIALRMNSGAASYEAKSGKYAPIMFHKWLRYPEKMRMPDYIGWLTDGRCFALEAKRPSWSKPRDDREREQAAFLEAIRKMGGTAGFARSADEAKIIIEG